MISKVVAIGNVDAVWGCTRQLANIESNFSCSCKFNNILSSALTSGDSVAKSLVILSAACLGCTNLSDLLHKNVGLVAHGRVGNTCR